MTGPTQQEVHDAAAMQGVSAKQAEEFWLHYESQGWKRANGQPVENWRTLLTLWLRDVYQMKPKETKTTRITDQICRKCGSHATSFTANGICGKCYERELAK